MQHILELGIHRDSPTHTVLFELLTLQERRDLYGKNGMSDYSFSNLHMFQVHAKQGAYSKGYYRLCRADGLELRYNYYSPVTHRLDIDQVRQQLIEIITQTKQLTLFT